MPLCRISPLRTVTATLTLLVAGALGVALAPPAARAEPSSSDLTQQLAQANQQLDSIVEAYDQATDRLADLRQRSATVAASLAPLQAQASEYDVQLGALVTGLYEQGASAGLSALLGAATPGAVLDDLGTMSYFAYQRSQLLSGYQAASQALNAQQDTLDLLAAQVRNQLAGLSAQQATIEARIAALRQLRSKVYGSSRPSPPRVDSFVPAYQAGPAGVAVQYAFKQIGKAYQYGADGPNTYDCSGLVMASWQQAGVSLPHSAAQQWRVVSHISASQLQPGDLVFYYSDIHHVALYIGGGRVVHAPTWGQSVTTAPVGIASIYGYGRVKL